MSEDNFDKHIDESTSSKEHAELIKACNRFIESTDDVDILCAGLSQCLAMSATSINKPEMFIQEMANQAIRAHRFATAMALSLSGCENVTNH